MKTIVLNLIFLLSSIVFINAQTVTFHMPDIPDPGSTVAVPVTITQCDSACMIFNSFQVFIEYNQTGITPIDINYTNPNLPFYEWSINLAYEPNLIIITYLSFSGGYTIVPPEELFEIVFSYSGGCSDLIMTGDSWGNCTLLFENGSVGCPVTPPEATLRMLEFGSEPEGSIYQPIIIDNINDNIGFAEFYILYDPTVLTPISVSYPNPDYLFYEWSNNLTYGPNEIILTWLSFSGGVDPAPGDTMCIVEFDYVGTPDYSDITWNHYDKDSIEILQKGNTSLWTLDGTSYELNLIDGGVGLLSGGPHEWTGLVDNDWHNPLNWLGLSLPTGWGVRIETSDNQPIMHSEDSIINLCLFPGTSLTIAPSGKLTVTETITNLSEINVKSDKYGKSGSLITNEIDYVPYGQLNFERRINTFGTAGNINTWHNISSPIDNFSTNDILDYYVNSWDVSSDEWQVISNGDPCNPTNPAVNINPMQGWSIKLNQDIPITCPPGGTGAIIEFEGSITNLHVGSYSIPFTANTSGYNLLGNPYPSYVDPSLIIWPDNLNQAIYFQSAWAESYWSWVGGIGPNIPPAQGFFVKATDDGTLTFTGDERVHDSISTNELPANEKLLCLKVTNHENQLFDLTYIRFKEESSPGFDQQWDAYKMFTESKHTPQVYTKSTIDDLSINTMPETASVPVYFTYGKSSNFIIEASQVENFEEVYLEDLLTGEMADLLDQEYSFNYDPGGNPGRFVVHFNLTGVSESMDNGIKYWSSNGSVCIELAGSELGDLYIYNTIGQRILQTKLNKGMNEIPLQNLNSVYILKVVTSNRIITKKVFLTK